MADTTILKEIQTYSSHLRGLYAERNRIMDAMERMLLLLWDDESKVANRRQGVKITKSPSARNKLLGAIRLLTATEPEWSVPVDKNDLAGGDTASKIEKAAADIWTKASRLSGNPLHYDVVTSALTFGEMHIAVTRTADLLAAAQGGAPASVARAEDLAAASPYLFDVWDPRTGYPDLGPHGLRAFYREVATTSGEVLDNFGDAAREIFKDGNRWVETTLCHFWDPVWRVSWVAGHAQQPLVMEEHKLPLIPVVVQLSEGSRLFTKPEYQRQPFLYGLYKSKMWERENLALTVFFTTLFQMGLTPSLVFQSGDPTRSLDLDWDALPAVIKIMTGESLAPLANKGLLDPSFLEGMRLTEKYTTESTIFDQTLGAPLAGGNAPFSSVALLSQAGRLPLVAPQRQAGWAIADVMKIALRWAKAEGWGGKYEGPVGALKVSEIPKHFELEAVLDVSLPQDKLQQANVAKRLTEGDNPLVSNQWTRENILGVGQSEEMETQIWGERAASLLFQRFALEQQMQIDQLKQQLMQPPAMPGMPPPGMPGNMPPQMPPGGPPNGMPPGDVMQGGLPPVMEQGGAGGPLPPPGMPGEGMPV
jgi:hypothetical protein